MRGIWNAFRTDVSYVELHAHSCYSLLDGAARPEELVTRAAALGMKSLRDDRVIRYEDYACTDLVSNR